MFGRRKKKHIPYEYVNRWQLKVFESLGVTPMSDTTVLKEACRRILLETGKFYENIIRIEDGMKPLE